MSGPYSRERRGEIGGHRRPGPEKPTWHHWIWKADWAWRRIVPLIAIGLAMFAVIELSSKVDSTQSQLDAQREGRKVAAEVLCGGLHGVQEAGRMILTGELPPPAPKGPQLSQKQSELSRRYAQAYASVISESVLLEAGISGERVLRADGTIDCALLKEVAGPYVPLSTTP